MCLAGGPLLGLRLFGNSSVLARLGAVDVQKRAANILNASFVVYQSISLGSDVKCIAFRFLRHSAVLACLGAINVQERAAGTQRIIMRSVVGMSSKNC